MSFKLTLPSDFQQSQTLPRHCPWVCSYESALGGGWNSTIEEVSDLVRQEGHHTVSHHRYIGPAFLYDSMLKVSGAPWCVPPTRVFIHSLSNLSSLILESNPIAVYNCMIASLSVSIHYHYPLYDSYYHLLRWILVSISYVVGSLVPLPAHHQSGKRAEWQDLGRQSQISVGLQWPAVWEKDWLVTIPL